MTPPDPPADAASPKSERAEPAADALPAGASAPPPRAEAEWTPVVRPPAASPRRRRVGRRLWVYLLALVLGAAATSHLTRPTTPSEKVEALLAQAEAAAGKRTTFSGGGGFFHVFPDEGYYVITIYVGDARDCAPAEYVTLQDIGKGLRVDVMLEHQGGTGGAEVSLLGEARESFLQKAGLLATPVRVQDAITRVYGQPTAPQGAAAAPGPGKR